MMRTRLCLAVVVVIGLLAAGAGWTQPGGNDRFGGADGPGGVDRPAGDHRQPTPGVKLAQTVTAVTGIAISPLLGVSAVGAWKYYATPGPRRGALPWYASPYFWIPGLGIVALLAAKDLLLGAFPFVKKPFDLLEVFENKVSALIVAPAVVPMILETVGVMLPPAAGDLSLGAGPGAVGDAVAGTGCSLAGIGDGSLRGLQAAILAAITLALGGFVFAVVWLAGHAINLLILLSPFGIVDLALKLLRFAVLAILVGAAQINPYLGALVAVLLVYLALRMAGWSARLTVMGTHFAWDILTLAHRQADAPEHPVTGFLSRCCGGARKRTYGRLEADGQGGLRFSYRPYLVLPRRTISLPAGPYTLAKDILAPTLLYSRPQATRPVALVNLPPRYRSHEGRVAAGLGIADLRSTAIERGLRAAADWLRGFAGAGPEADPCAAP